jgi:hypothetical protein
MTVCPYDGVTVSQYYCQTVWPVPLLYSATPLLHYSASILKQNLDIIIDA